MQPHPLDRIRCQCESIGDAVRWACLLEATAPKAGNVYPGREFGDLSFTDFVSAAEIAADAFNIPARRFSESILSAVQLNQSVIGSNANLGILLLLGPLTEVAHEFDRRVSQKNIAHTLSLLTEQDASNVFQAIRLATPGGLGKVDKMDVTEHNSESSGDELNLVEAMRLGRERDSIALQYTTDFADLLERIVPVIDRAIIACGDVLTGIANAHLELLASQPDTLIARKCGKEIAMGVMERAKQVDLENKESRDDFDRYLRSDGNRLNPGTTADLIAAGLFVLILR